MKSHVWSCLAAGLTSDQRIIPVIDSFWWLFLCFCKNVRKGNVFGSSCFGWTTVQTQRDSINCALKQGEAVLTFEPWTRNSFAWSTWTVDQLLNVLLIIFLWWRNRWQLQFSAHYSEPFWAKQKLIRLSWNQESFPWLEVQIEVVVSYCAGHGYRSNGDSVLDYKSSAQNWWNQLFR